MMSKKTVALSGGFDPIHIGHVRMIRDAARNYSVVIILNSDDWLMRKKGYVFMNWEERSEILLAIKGVDNVYAVNDEDDTVCGALSNIKPDFFGNGGDRKNQNTPEVNLCEENSIGMLWNLGGEKIQSSSTLVGNQKKPE